jgi:hypothetical protein
MVMLRLLLHDHVIRNRILTDNKTINLLQFRFARPSKT